MSYFLGSEKSRFVNGEHQDSKTFDDCVENIISELNKYDNSVNSYDLKCEYIKNELGKLPRKPDGEIATIPQYIRLGIYYIAYTEYIKSLNNDDNTFRQDDLLKKLNLSKNMFQKWNLYPQKDAALYGKRIFNPSLVRKGAKRVKLCRLIRLLLTSQEAEYFADVFGGMGIVTSNVISYFKRPSFFNELDSVIFNMLHYIQVDKKALLKRCRGIFEDISKFKDEDNPMWYYGEERHDKNVFSFINEDFLPPLYGIYQGAYKNVIPDKYSESTQNTFYHWLERLENENISDEKKIEQELLIAAYTYFVFSFKINRGVSKADISGVNEFKFCLFLEKLKCDVSDWYSHQYIKRKFEDITISYDRKTSESEIYRWSDSLKDIEMTKKDYRDFYDYVSSKVDIEKIIWYFDPPYFLTAQYKNTFSDEQHVDLINILKEISAKGGKWVFSCKDEITNKSETKIESKSKSKKVSEYRKGKDKKGAIIMSFEEYLRGFSDDVTFEIDSNNTYYLRYRKERVKNHNLYVYKLEDEKNAEILITNFDFPESVVSLLNSSLSKSNKIPKFIKEDFHKHFHAKFAKVKIEK